MANRTDPLAATVHGTNPQVILSIFDQLITTNLVEKIVRSRIYDCQYWKEHCFALTAESLLDKAVELGAIGGTFGGARKPAEFLCLILKLLQLQPDKEIVIEYIKNEDYKYVRVLGAFYLRLVGKPLEVYQYLEPLYNDYRKIRERKEDGAFGLTHMDEIVFDMLHKDHLFDVALPRIPHRLTLERLGQLDSRLSVLDNDFDEAALEAEAAGDGVEAAQLLTDSMDLIGGGDEAATRARERDEERGREKWRERDRKERKRERSTSPRRLPSPPRREERRDREAPPPPPPRDRELDRDRGKDRRDERQGDRRDDRRDDRDRERRSRSRDRERKRHSSRSRSRDRDHKKERREGKDRHEKGEAKMGGSKEDLEMQEQQAMRAKLGLKPLRY